MIEKYPEKQNKKPARRATHTQPFAISFFFSPCPPDMYASM